MSKFKVGDRVRFRGTDLAMTVRGIHDRWYWCEHDDAALGTYIGADLHPIPPDPVEVLAKLERLVRSCKPGCPALYSPEHYGQRDWVVCHAHGDTLAAAIMAAPEPEAGS